MSLAATRAVWTHSRQTAPGALVLLLAIAERTDWNGEARATLPLLAEMTRMDRRNVQRYLRQLEQGGELASEIGRGRGITTVYRLLLPIEKAAPTPPFTEARPEEIGGTYAAYTAEKAAPTPPIADEKAAPLVDAGREKAAPAAGKGGTPLMRAIPGYVPGTGDSGYLLKTEPVVAPVSRARRAKAAANGRLPLELEGDDPPDTGPTDEQRAGARAMWRVLRERAPEFSPPTDWWLRIAQRYGNLDLAMEAHALVGWLGKKHDRKLSEAFVTNWLKKANREGANGSAAQGAGGQAHGAKPGTLGPNGEITYDVENDPWIRDAAARAAARGPERPS